MTTQKLILKDFAGVAATTVVCLSLSALSKFANERYWNNKYDPHLLEVFSYIIPYLIFILIRQILRRYSANEHIHTSFTTSDILRPSSDGDSERFNVDKMYDQLTELVKEAGIVRIVDNTTSQLDHIQNLTSRNKFLQEIENRLRTNKDFRYYRLELAYVDKEKLNKNQIQNTIEEVKRSLKGATKKHCDVVSELRNANVYVLPINKIIGTYLIFDEKIICFQIDGVELGESQPSDLITIIIDRPKELMLLTYQNRFEKLVGYAQDYSKI